MHLIVTFVGTLFQPAFQLTAHPTPPPLPHLLPPPNVCPPLQTFLSTAMNHVITQHLHIQLIIHQFPIVNQILSIKANKQDQ